MDKTGTLTLGKPSVPDVVVVPGVDREQVLALVVAVETGERAPLAQSVVRHAEGLGRRARAARRFVNVPGEGAVAIVDGRRVVVGNTRLVDREGIDLGGLAGPEDDLASGGRTVVVAAVDGRAAAVIADATRPTAKSAVDALHELEVRVVMLTGDNAATARRIAGRARHRRSDRRGPARGQGGEGRRAPSSRPQGPMVGDGNDAPALVEADLGTAIGAGTDVALDAADVVLWRVSWTRPTRPRRRACGGWPLDLAPADGRA